MRCCGSQKLHQQIEGIAAIYRGPTNATHAVFKINALQQHPCYESRKAARMPQRTARMLTYLSLLINIKSPQ